MQRFLRLLQKRLLLKVSILAFFDQFNFLIILFNLSSPLGPGKKFSAISSSTECSDHSRFFKLLPFFDLRDVIRGAEQKTGEKVHFHSTDIEKKQTEKQFLSKNYLKNKKKLKKKKIRKFY